MKSGCQLLVLVLSTTAILAQEGKTTRDKDRIPTLSELLRVAGTNSDDDSFQTLLRAYRFTENPKRKRSWGSAFGVFLEVTKDGSVVVGIRPSPIATKTPTYNGELPHKLTPDASIAEIERTLGRPRSTSGEPSEQYIMMYEGLHVVAVNGRLFEIWLTAAPKH